ncbi:hypothetical protein BH10ACI4_BH10ACI4_19890 [soil metagenome]
MRAEGIQRPHHSVVLDLTLFLEGIQLDGMGFKSGATKS